MKKILELFLNLISYIVMCYGMCTLMILIIAFCAWDDRIFQVIYEPFPHRLIAITGLILTIILEFSKTEKQFINLK